MGSRPYFTHPVSKLSYMVIVIATLVFILACWDLGFDFSMQLLLVFLYGLYFYFIIRFKKLEGRRFSKMKYEIAFHLLFLGLVGGLQLASFVLPWSSGFRFDPMYRTIYFAPLNEELYRLFYIFAIFLLLTSFRSEDKRNERDKKFYGVWITAFIISNLIWLFSHTQYNCSQKLGISIHIVFYFFFYLCLEIVLVGVLFHAWWNSLAVFIGQGRPLPEQGVQPLLFSGWFLSITVIFSAALITLGIWADRRGKSRDQETKARTGVKRKLKCVGVISLCLACPFALQAQLLFWGFPQAITLYNGVDEWDESPQIFSIKHEDSLYFDYHSTPFPLEIVFNFSTCLIHYRYLKYVCRFHSLGYLSGFNITITSLLESNETVVDRRMLNASTPYYSSLVRLPCYSGAISLRVLVQNITTYPFIFQLDQFMLLA